MCARAHAALAAPTTHDSTFGIMPSRDLPVGDELLHAGDVDARDQRALVGPVAVDAGDVGEVHELLGVERLGHRARDGVGVHVVGLTVVVDADGRDHRDQLLAEHAAPRSWGRSRARRRRSRARIALVDPDEPGVLAREPDRVRAVPVHRRDDLAVDLADERHADDVDGLGVGDPPPVDELGLLAEPAHEIADLRAAAVHDDRVHADQSHEHDVGREEIGERGIAHRVAAVLDHDGLARELADVRAAPRRGSTAFSPRRGRTR